MAKRTAPACDHQSHKAGSKEKHGRGVWRGGERKRVRRHRERIRRETAVRADPGARARIQEAGLWRMDRERRGTRGKEIEVGTDGSRLRSEARAKHKDDRKPGRNGSECTHAGPSDLLIEGNGAGSAHGRPKVMQNPGTA